MSKAADMAKTSAKGGFHLLWGYVISTVISSVGTIFIARLLGSDLYGLYGIVINITVLISVFRDWGITNALTRYTAQYRSTGRDSEIKSIFIAGILFELILGITLSIVALLLSGFIANDFYNRPEITPLIQIASISVLASGLITLSTAVFTGIEKMQYNSVMLIVQSIIKTFLIIGLVLLGLGTSGAIIGYTVGCLAAGLVGVLFILHIYRTIPKPITIKLEVKEYTRELLKYGIPLSLSSILSGFLSQYYSTLIPYFYADNSLVGNYNIAYTFVVLITFFSLPIGTMLFPAFSKLDYRKDYNTLKNVFQFSVKYSTLIVVPVTALVMSLSEPAITTLFEDKYSLAPTFLALLSINYLFTAIGSMSIPNLLYGQGQTKLVLKVTILTAAIGIPLGYFLIMHYSVLGLIITHIVASIPSQIVMLTWIKKNYNLTVDWVSSAKILVASAIPAIITYLTVISLPYYSWLKLIIGVIIFITILVPSILMTKSINHNDIENLRQMTTSLGPVGKILRYILDILKKIIILLRL